MASRVCWLFCAGKDEVSGLSLHRTLEARSWAGAIVATDGWSGYDGLAKLGYFHHQLSRPATRGCGSRGS